VRRSHGNVAAARRPLSGAIVNFSSLLFSSLLFSPRPGLRRRHLRRRRLHLRRRRRHLRLHEPRRIAGTSSRSPAATPVSAATPISLISIFFDGDDEARGKMSKVSVLLPARVQANFRINEAVLSQTLSPSHLSTLTPPPTTTSNHRHRHLRHQHHHHHHPSSSPTTAHPQ
jgi:hypothetical protein